MTAVLDAPPIESAEELPRLEVLREYKKIFAGDGTSNRSPFADDRVIRFDSEIGRWDVPEIHDQVRAAIRDNIAELHQGKFSRVVILAGQPGVGKTHLINYFRDTSLQKELGYVFVGNNNFWKADEFEEYLLTWLVAALTKPNIQGPNHLLEKLSDLAFQALEQILDRPGQIQGFLGSRSLGIFGRIISRFGPDKHAFFRKGCQERDLSIFKQLDFHRFADFVCDRFLHEKSNAFHRFVLYVLLRYLFPEDREKVCAWLVNQKVHETFFQSLGGKYRVRSDEPNDPAWPTETEIEEHFQKEFGVSDRLNLNYKLIDTIKILVSLFSPEVNFHAERNGKLPGRIFFFAFDQMEGREELFENEKDWFKFFAKLSELYNYLPNVFITFTMTNHLRNKLYSKMEAQFQQRILRDKKFVLEEIEDDELLAVFRRHMELWRGRKLSEESEAVLAQPGNEYLPFSQEEVLSLSRQKTLRDSLVTFDEKFRSYLDERVVVGADARVDFLVAVNELKAREKDFKPFDYTDNHITVVDKLLQRTMERLGTAFGLSIVDLVKCPTEGNLTALKLEFRSPDSEKRWVRVFIGNLPFQYRPKLDGLANLLFGKSRKRYFMWLVRATAKGIDLGALAPRKDQVFRRPNLEATVQTRFAALLNLLDKQDALEETLGISNDEKQKYRADVDQIVIEEIKLTYLGEMFQHAAETLETLGEGGDDDAE